MQKPHLPVRKRQTTPSHVSQYWAENGNLRKSGSTFRHGTVFAPKQCFYQKEALGMDSPKIHFSSRCKTALTCAGRQTTPSHVSQYRAENGNLQKYRSTFRHGTVFTPKQCLCQKEATGMESPKMHFSSWYKYRTYLCGTANYPFSCKPVYDLERKLEEIRVYLSPWYRVTPKKYLYQNEATRMESPKIQSSSRCKNRTYLCRTANYPVSCKPV